MTRFLVALLGLACLVGVVLAGEAAKRSLKIFDAYPRAKLVPVPTNANELVWMEDLWICTDRSLRHPRHERDPFRDIYSLEWSAGSITTPSQYRDGCYLPAWGTEVADRRNQVHGPTNYLIFNFYPWARGVTLGGPGSADFLHLKRDTNTPPQWFIFEHQDSGDVLLFERAGTNASVQSKR